MSRLWYPCVPRSAATTGSCGPSTSIAAPRCTPSRASLLTGLYTHNHQTWSNGTPWPFEHKTMAHMFGRAGYMSALIGKMHFVDAQTHGFDYRLECYVPAPRRRYGYYVLPILHGDRLIGRLDPVHDKKAGILRVNAVHVEPGAPAGAWPAVRRALDALAKWVGHDEVVLPRLPRPWR